MTSELRDVQIPLAETAGGDFAVVTGDDLVRQRVQLGFATTPGEFHDQDWGAGLVEALNAKPTPGMRATVRRRAERFLASVPGVEEYAVEVTRAGEGVLLVSAQLNYNGRQVLVPEIRLA